MANRSPDSSGQRRRNRFTFTAPLVKRRQGINKFVLEVPQSISAAIGRRGPVPIIATLRKGVEVQASLVPVGGGRHTLQLNGEVRRELQLELGDSVRVSLVVPDQMPALHVPAELASALREAGLVEAFEALPYGKRGHIIRWIEKTVMPQTLQKRIDLTLQVTFRAAERAFERANSLAKSGKAEAS
jgi:Domain of unknown function (DUF1905)/Bacteriocin-protection, YdeI or OmpD-Associated